MDKKGYTLVELIGIIVVIGIIALIAIPNIINTLKKTDTIVYEDFLKNVELAAEYYIDKNRTDFDLKEPGDNIFVKIVDLVNAGLLDKTMVNPKTKEPINMNHTVLVTVENNYTKSFNFTTADSSLVGYVNDGLLLQYDGYQKLKNVNNKIIWKDLIGESDAEIVNGNGINDWVDNKIKLENINHYISAKGSSNLVNVNDDLTVEIVYTLYENTYDPLFRNNGLGLYYFDLYKTGLLRSMVRNIDNTDNEMPIATDTNLITMGKLHTISVTAKKTDDYFEFQYYGDSKKMQMSKNYGKKHSINDFQVGKNYENGISKVYIHGFRIYNRALNDTEIKMNFDKDINRYDWRNIQ